jgi:ABC-type transporter Mla subunit MlaD
MKEFFLILVLIAGLVGGYFIGDYQGKKAKEALNQVIENGKKLTAELDKTRSALDKRLGAIDEEYNKYLNASREDFAKRAAEWQRVKADLQNLISRQKTELETLSGNIKSLSDEFNKATGEEKARLGKELEGLQKAADQLRIEYEGNVCLTKKVPSGVFAILNDKSKIGGK